MANRFGHALVTGGAGFLGSQLCERLLGNGHRVTCVDSFATGRPDNIAHLHGHPRFELVEHDMTRPVEGSAVPTDVDLVFHLASAASPKDYQRLAIDTLRVGALGTEHALRLAANAGARFLLTSTSEVYGDPLEHPQRETYWGNVNPIGPRSVYDEAKRYAEALTMAYLREHGTNVAIARVFNTYGPRMRADDGRVIPAFITQALTGRPLTVAGTGEQTRSVCYVDDTVGGLLSLAYSSLHGPVNIGNPDELSVRRIAEEILSLTGVSVAVTTVEGAVDDPRRRCPDITLARAELGWLPSVGLREGLNRTIAWFARNAVADHVSA
ncbi:dTDP-glucose 4,6-dehydratase [Saccharomonospora amisosensis]|uniref:dTDP-glucose 4,6-dehydratase n=1 Tax=Saccharomonospora amisosensis TaxID=1128677 RepID=A0A7X5ZS01_9PSEU|nr:UDP-glucuronic acid decarboxylase family protein [Saccharomonospora amisosensis]NIJ13403.1 dTDP-glucose 4,6-dehydratase [Saccharomonospora amisosensis]